MMALLILVTAHADCPSTIQALRARLEAAEQSFEAMQEAPFQAELEAITTEAGCLTEVISPESAARIHRVMAMGEFLNQDDQAATASFRAQISAYHDLGLPQRYTPDQHPLQQLYRAAQEIPDPFQPMSLDDGVRLWVDGTAAQERPASRPALLQVTGTDIHQVLSSELLAGEASFTAPMLPTPEPVLPLPDPDPVPADPKRRPTLGLALGAGAALVTTGVLYGLGASSKGKHADPMTPYEDLDGLRKNTNGLHFGAQITGGVAVGLGGAAVISGVL